MNATYESWRSHAIEVEETLELRTYKKYPMQIVRGEGCYVYNERGRRFLDFYGGHAVASVGHCHPRVVEAIRRQSGQLLFYSNVAYSPARAEAVQELFSVLPEGFRKVFLVNSGSEANENALKMAWQFTGRRQIISFENSFHGRTLGSLSITGMGRYRGKFPHVPDIRMAEFGNLDSVRRAMGPDTAAVFLEPIQSMAGVIMAPPDFYQGLRELCDEYGTLLIYDEVQTGTGRTGDFLFSGYGGVYPDLVTLAKGIASGLPAGAVLIRSPRADSVSIGDYGTTFGGGPVVCAAMAATLQVWKEEKLRERVRTYSPYLMDSLRGMPGVREVRGLGYLVGIRLEAEAKILQHALLERQVLTGLSEDPEVLRLLPPLTLRQEEIDQFLEVFRQVAVSCVHA
ncbi:MAG: aspartate aminotransferase family protein [Acidobacteria bacterium]|nr:aspartate aminotransferase family protein [Acidobacteriota bacterium]